MPPLVECVLRRRAPQCGPRPKPERSPRPYRGREIASLIHGGRGRGRARVWEPDRMICFSFSVTTCTATKGAPESPRISRRDLLRVVSSTAGAAVIPEAVWAPAPAWADPQTATAIFAGGCFWCMEKPFDVLPGVISTTAGYSGGNEKNPTYRQVGSGRTGHAECISVEYDPAVIGYDQLLDVFWHQIDPTTPNRQFCDKGKQYRTAIFYQGEEQKRLALESKEKYEKEDTFGGKIVTEITAAKTFWDAEDYHQDYYLKNPELYAFYRANCGRDRYLESVWGKAESSFSAKDVPAAIRQRLGL